jgi:Guanylate kinase
MKKKPVVILTGPSCSGKSYLSQEIIRLGGVGEAISTTTREPRVGEINGQHYHFISKEEFNEKFKNGDFVEKIEFSGKLYGVTAGEFEKLFALDIAPLIIVEPNGAEMVYNYCKEKNWNPISLFVNTPQKLAVSRFYDRFIVDSLAGKANDSYYASRITEVLTTESNWRKMFDYDHIIPVSDTPAVAISLANQIKKEVDLIKDGVGSKWESIGVKKIKQSNIINQNNKDSINNEILLFLKSGQDLKADKAVSVIINIARSYQKEAEALEI